MSVRREPAPTHEPLAKTTRDALTAGLWEQFRESFSTQVCVLEEATVAVLSGELSEQLRERALREAHKLAGSLGTFGMPRGSEVAREVESWFGPGLHEDATDVLRLSDAVVVLRRCVDAGPMILPAGTMPGREPLQPFLLLVDDDPVLAYGLRLTAASLGLGLEVALDVGAARHVLAGRQPEVVIVEVAGVATDAVFGFMGELRARVPPIPVVVLTRAGTFTDRVEAARLGGSGFFEKPVAAGDVLLAVGEVIARTRAARATVLVVDDDPAVLAALGALLEAQGQRVVTLNEPLQFWETLKVASPDLVVLDVDMPELNGVEMCQVMRADQRWSGVPVVFLTVRTDAETVQAIFSAGADDYVAKPLVGAELTTRIFNRLERSRLLRRMAETDLLTGVANQPTSAKAMERLLGMAERFGQPAAAAVVDVDRVRSLNDHFGYEAGDQVLATLGRLLLACFSGDDTVGRWAGQEFFVGMSGMTRGDGVQRLAEVLEELRGQRFSDGRGGSFAVSFSAGVAQYPDDGTDVASLHHGADSALRMAKQAGRNRVLPVGWTGDEESMVDVVLVEDDAAVAGILLQGLATRGWRTRRFDDGQDAVTALEGPSAKVSARVVLLDCGLPSLDGLRVLRRLAETDVLSRTRVIMLTARDSESEVLQALDLGAFDHVAKPFSVPVLMKRVHRAMEWS